MPIDEAKVKALRDAFLACAEGDDSSTLRDALHANLKDGQSVLFIGEGDTVTVGEPHGETYYNDTLLAIIDCRPAAVKKDPPRYVFGTVETTAYKVPIGFPKGCVRVTFRASQETWGEPLLELLFAPQVWMAIRSVLQNVSSDDLPTTGVATLQALVAAVGLSDPKGVELFGGWFQRTRGFKYPEMLMKLVYVEAELGDQRPAEPVSKLVPVPSPGLDSALEQNLKAKEEADLAAREAVKRGETAGGESIYFMTHVDGREIGELKLPQHMAFILDHRSANKSILSRGDKIELHYLQPFMRHNAILDDLLSQSAVDGPREIYIRKSPYAAKQEG